MPATQAQLNEVTESVLAQIRSMLVQGQKEYANEDNVLQNFEDIAKEVGITREQVLYTFFKKHLDGIKNHIKGFESQREPVDGRITDAMVYLVLFTVMVREKRGDFLDKSNGQSSLNLSTENTKEAYSDGHPKPETSTRVMQSNPSLAAPYEKEVGQSSGLNSQQSEKLVVPQEFTRQSSTPVEVVANEPATRYVSPLKDG